MVTRNIKRAVFAFFKIRQDTTSGINIFSILRFKNQLYGNTKNQIEQDSIPVYWSYVASGLNYLNL